MKFLLFMILALTLSLKPVVSLYGYYETIIPFDSVTLLQNEDVPKFIYLTFEPNGLFRSFDLGDYVMISGRYFNTEENLYLWYTRKNDEYVSYHITMRENYFIIDKKFIYKKTLQFDEYCLNTLLQCRQGTVCRQNMTCGQ